MQYLDGPPPDGPFAIYHQSFREFLFSRDRAGNFAIDEYLQHELIADRFTESFAGSWETCPHRYGLQYVPMHLADASRVGPPERKLSFAQQLVDIALDQNFQDAHAAQIADPLAMHGHLERAVEAASRASGPRSIEALLRAALGLAAFRQKQLQPANIFELARRGQLRAAQRQLELFVQEPHWRQATLLSCAWLAIAAQPDESRALIGQVEQDLLGHIRPLRLLHARSRAASAQPPMPAALPPLPLEVSPATATAIMIRTRGVDLDQNPSMLGNFAPSEALHQEDVSVAYLESQASLVESDAAPVFLSEQEAPILVACAVSYPQTCAAYVQEYLSLHAANDYVLYRNRSLWGILKSILLHPEDEWARDMTARVVAGALAGARIHFQKALPLSVVGREAAIDPNSAPARFAAAVNTAVAAARALGAGRGSDSWAFHKRHLGALAEVTHLALRRDGRNLAALARDLPFGFAGYQSPACLSAAETSAIVSPDEPVHVERMLNAAMQAAHNVQDSVFCARTTSRVNAMCSDFWGATGNTLGAFDPLQVAGELASNPAAPKFSPLHLVGELYEHRNHGESRVNLGTAFLGAHTLRQLAENVYQLPVVEFLRINREEGWEENTHLPAGARVRVPDPDYRALVAARIAAEAARNTKLSVAERTQAIRLVVPAIGDNPTVLDTVLSRLVLVASLSAVELASLDPLVAGYTAPVNEPTHRRTQLTEGPGMMS